MKHRDAWVKARRAWLTEALARAERHERRRRWFMLTLIALAGVSLVLALVKLFVL